MSNSHPTSSPHTHSFLPLSCRIYPTSRYGVDRTYPYRRTPYYPSSPKFLHHVLRLPPSRQYQVQARPCSAYASGISGVVVEI